MYKARERAAALIRAGAARAISEEMQSTINTVVHVLIVGVVVSRPSRARTARRPSYCGTLGVKHTPSERTDLVHRPRAGARSSMFGGARSAGRGPPCAGRGGGRDDHDQLFGTRVARRRRRGQDDAGAAAPCAAAVVWYCAVDEAGVRTSLGWSDAGRRAATLGEEEAGGSAVPAASGSSGGKRGRAARASDGGAQRERGREGDDERRAPVSPRE